MVCHVEKQGEWSNFSRFLERKKKTKPGHVVHSQMQLHMVNILPLSIQREVSLRQLCKFSVSVVSWVD